MWGHASLPSFARLISAPFVHTQIVLDTNVWISAMHSTTGPARETVETVLHGPCRMHLTAPLVFEYEEKLFAKSRLVGLSKSEIVDLIDYICAVGETHPKTWFRAPLFVTDPGDAFVLDAVLSTPATALVTRNTVDFTGDRQFLGARSWNVPLLTPREYLAQLS